MKVEYQENFRETAYIYVLAATFFEHSNTLMEQKSRLDKAILGLENILQRNNYFRNIEKRSLSK